MDTNTMFEYATRMKLRFNSPKGQLTVEDLWDLPLTATRISVTNLDAIAIDLYRQTKDAGEMVSFVTPAADNGRAAELQLKLDIVKHIISVRVKERDERQAEADRREKKMRLMELIARKEDEALGQKSVDELRAMVEAL
jgi:hypothetical protein